MVSFLSFSLPEKVQNTWNDNISEENSFGAS